MDTGFSSVTSARDPAVGSAIRMQSCLPIEAPKFTRHVFGAKTWNNLVSILVFFSDVAISRSVSAFKLFIDCEKGFHATELLSR